MLPQIEPNAGPVIYATMAGIEMALWDIVGQACGQPAYSLAEGKVRTRVVIFIVSSFTKKTDPSVADA